MGNNAIAQHGLSMFHEAQGLCGCQHQDFHSSAKTIIELHGIDAWNAKDLVRDNLTRQVELAKQSPLKKIDVEEGLKYLKKKFVGSSDWNSGNFMNAISGKVGNATKEQFVRTCSGLLKDQRLGVAHSPKDVDDLPLIFDSMDFDGNGDLSIGEWAGGMSVFFKGDAKHAVYAVFDTLDVDGNGRLSKAELTEYLRPFIKAMSPADADALRPILLKKATNDIFRGMDLDGNDNVDKEEFFKWTLADKRNNIIDKLADIIDGDVYEIVLKQRDQKRPGAKLGSRNSTAQDTTLVSDVQREISQQSIASQLAPGMPGHGPPGFPTGPPGSGYMEQAGGWQQEPMQPQQPWPQQQQQQPPWQQQQPQPWQQQQQQPSSPAHYQQQPWEGQPPQQHNWQPPQQGWQHQAPPMNSWQQQQQPLPGSPQGGYGASSEWSSAAHHGRHEDYNPYGASPPPRGGSPPAAPPAAGGDPFHGSDQWSNVPPPPPPPNRSGGAPASQGPPGAYTSSCGAGPVRGSSYGASPPPPPPLGSYGRDERPQEPDWGRSAYGPGPGSGYGGAGGYGQGGGQPGQYGMAAGGQYYGASSSPYSGGGGGGYY